MIDQIYFEIVENYLATATEEEKRVLIQSHRSFERFYLQNGYYCHRKEYQLSVGEFIMNMSILLDDTAKELGLEPLEVYYPKLKSELDEYRHLEESKETVETCVPTEA